MLTFCESYNVYKINFNYSNQFLRNGQEIPFILDTALHKYTIKNCFQEIKPMLHEYAILKWSSKITVYGNI